MATEKQREASRRNARKSTGPRTVEGKDRSRYNAVKHGMTAKTPVLPGEDEGAFQKRVESWKDDLRPRGAVEDFLVERAARISWQLDRVERAHTARLAQRILEGTEDADHDPRAEAADLGRRLFWDRRGPLPLYPHTPISNALIPERVPRTSFSGVVDDPDQPEALVHRLESTAAGCEWMLAQWAGLRELLDQGVAWQSPDKLKAIRLLGRQPLDAADDPRVAMVFLASGVLHAGREDVDPFDEVWKELLPGSAAIFKQRLEGRSLYDLAPGTQAEARAALLAIVDEATGRLERLAASHRERAEAIAVVAADRLAFDTTDEAERLRRYELACDRALGRTLNLVLKVRREGEGRPDPTQPDDSTKPETVAETSSEVHPGPADGAGRVESPIAIVAPCTDPIRAPVEVPVPAEGVVNAGATQPDPVHDRPASGASRPAEPRQSRDCDFRETKLTFAGDPGGSPSGLDPGHPGNVGREAKAGPQNCFEVTRPSEFASPRHSLRCLRYFCSRIRTPCKATKATA